MPEIMLFPELEEKIKQLESLDIPQDRKEVLTPLINFIQQKKDSGEPILLNFICTHNSRRSQLGQVWARAISEKFGSVIQSYSGGTETTAFHQNARAALSRAGFEISKETGENPHFRVTFAENAQALECYSKLYDAEQNPSNDFAAVMTCSHADENCPFIPGATARIALDYKDPKEFDGTPKAAEKYDERSDQIASEMIYVFKT